MWFVAVKVILTPFITYLFATLIAEDHILEKLGAWLNEKREDKLIWWRKPLGGCLICFNIWLTLISFFIPIDILAPIAFIGISNYLIQKL